MMMELLAKDITDDSCCDDSRDVVDFVRPTATRRKGGGTKTIENGRQEKNRNDRLFVQNETEMTSRVKSSIASLENLSIFKLPRSRTARNEAATGVQCLATTTINNEQTNGGAGGTGNNTASKDPLKFVKRTSIARLLGQTYSTKNASAANAKAKSAEAKTAAAAVTSASETTTSAAATTTATTITFPERFQRCSENHIDDAAAAITLTPQMSDFCEDSDLGTRTLKIISKGLGRIFWKKSYSVDISEPDPEFKVSYLGNVLTGWAKGKRTF